MSCHCGGCNSNIRLPNGAQGPAGPAGASATVPISNTVFVSKTGSDSTGLAERLDKPFLTISAAITAGIALSPDYGQRITIVVFGGVYTEDVLMNTSWMTLASAYPKVLKYSPNGYSDSSRSLEAAGENIYIDGTLTVSARAIDVVGINCSTLAVNVGSPQEGDNHFSHIIADTAITTDKTQVKATFYDVHSGAFLSNTTGLTLGGYLEKCTGTDGSFAGASPGEAGSIDGVLIDCVGEGDYTFAAGTATPGNISGTLIRCKATGGVSFASSSSGDGGTISGNLTDCISTGSGSFGYGGSGTGGTLSGNFIRCTGSSFSFGYGSFTGGTLSGIFENCRVESEYGFASSGTTGGTLSGNFNNCYGSETSFGWGDTTGGEISGKMINCSAGHNSFVSGQDQGGTISGTMINCVLTRPDYNDYSFASGDIGGIISGYLLNCVGGEGGNFSSASITGGSVTSTGIIDSCRIIGAGDFLRKAVLSGKLTRCDIDQQNSNEPGLIVDDEAVVSYCRIKGNGSAESIYASSAVDVSITFTSLFGLGTHSNVNNVVSTCYNIDDTEEIF